MRAIDSSPPIFPKNPVKHKKLFWKEKIFSRQDKFLNFRQNFFGFFEKVPNSNRQFPTLKFTFLGNLKNQAVAESLKNVVPVWNLIPDNICHSQKGHFMQNLAVSRKSYMRHIFLMRAIDFSSGKYP